MNNAVVQNVPNVPDAIAPWTFYTELRNCVVDFGRNNDARNSYRLARRTLLVQLHLMGNTKCQACSGHGHRARDCPTNSRLGMLGASNVEWQKLIAWARGKTLLVDRERQALLIDLPVNHRVPIHLNRKRLHCQAFK